MHLLLHISSIGDVNMFMLKFFIVSADKLIVGEMVQVTVR